jgi:uncharacterized protein YjbI with pentapeptide repeats
MRALLEIASCLIYAYWYYSILQVRKMANPEHLALLKQGIRAWNEWRQTNPDIKPNLSEADLSGVNLSGINFSKANLSRGRLHADLYIPNVQLFSGGSTEPAW